jgi:hypothetical protein
MHKCRALDLDVVENDEEHADLAWRQVQDANTYQIQVSEFPAEVCRQSKLGSELQSLFSFKRPQSHNLEPHPTPWPETVGFSRLPS